jgi:hypothetical protein
VTPVRGDGDPQMVNYSLAGTSIWRYTVAFTNGHMLRGFVLRF